MGGILQNILHVIWRGRKAIVECLEQRTNADKNVYDRNVTMQKIFGIVVHYIYIYIYIYI